MQLTTERVAQIAYESARETEVVYSAVSDAEIDAVRLPYEALQGDAREPFVARVNQFRYDGTLPPTMQGIFDITFDAVVRALR